MIDTGTIVAVITACGGGATVKLLVDVFTGRGRRKIENAASLTTATSEVLEIVKQQRDEFQQQAQQHAADAQEMRRQFADTRSELHEARVEIQDLRHRLDRIVAEEQQWARRNGHVDAPILGVTAG